MPSVRDRVGRLEADLAAAEALPDSAARGIAIDAIQGLMELYGAGLARIAELAPDALPRLAEDELVGHLLLLHDLHPVSVRERVTAALEEVRPYLATHGGNVELLSISDGVARVRLVGTCHGCPSSTQTLKHAIEEAIFKIAPDVARVEAEGVAAPQSIVTIDSLVCPVA